MKNLKLIALSTGLLAFTAFISPKETLTIDTNSSEVKWTGYHLAKSYEHWGNVTVKSGSLEVSGDNITGGKIVIDMTSISNGDLDDKKDNDKLVKHLKSDEFFGVAKFPEAVLDIKSATKDGNKHKVTADLTVRGITKEISFEAIQDSTEEGTVFQSTLKVDRTAHEVMYGWTLENAVLSNEFQLEVTLVASR